MKSAPAPSERPRHSGSAIKGADPGTMAAGGGRFGWIRWAGAYFWIWNLMWNAEHFPWYARKARPFYLWWAWRTSKSMRQGTLANARWLLGKDSTPQQRIAMGKGVVGNFYDFIFELGRNRKRDWREPLREIEQLVGSEHYYRARALKRGLIVATAHLGSFETGVAALRQREEKIHVVFQRDAISRFEALRSSQRRRLGVIEAPVDEGWTVWLRLREALKNDEVVLMQADRVMPGQRGVRMPMLGGHVLLPTGPIKLALLTGAPILPVFAVRSGPGLVRLHMEPPLIVEESPDHEGGVHPAMVQLARTIERYISRYPEQWLMVNPVWCEDVEEKPAGKRESSPAGRAHKRAYT